VIIIMQLLLNNSHFSCIALLSRKCANVSSAFAVQLVMQSASIWETTGDSKFVKQGFMHLAAEEIPKSPSSIARCKFSFFCVRVMR